MLSIFGSTGLGFVLQNRLKAAYLEAGLLQCSFANADMAVFNLNGLLSEPVKYIFPVSLEFLFFLLFRDSG